MKSRAPVTSRLILTSLLLANILLSGCASHPAQEAYDSIAQDQAQSKRDAEMAHNNGQYAPIDDRVTQSQGVVALAVLGISSMANAIDKLFSEDD